MVSLAAIRTSNARVASVLPAGLIAVFVGATSGIGETSLKQFARFTKQPRIYFIGRSDEAGRRISAELKTLNPEGTYTFVRSDVSLLQNVDAVCRDIKTKETAINLLFLSPGTLISGTKTEEGLHFFMALTYYCRVRFIYNLLPLLQQASSLRRVVTVFAGGKEGRIYPDDFQGFNLGLAKGRGHIASMITLALYAASKKYPEVSFVHTYPGFVKTKLGSDTTGLLMTVAMAAAKVITTFHSVPIVEVGERHTFFGTSAKYPPSSLRAGEDGAGISVEQDVQVADGVDGQSGSGVYVVGVDGEAIVSKDKPSLAPGSADATAVWKHTDEEFRRITGTFSINEHGSS